SPGKCNKEVRGTPVTIVSIEDRRIVFMRERYPYLCMRPMYNLLTKFRKLIKEFPKYSRDQYLT
ncbi:DUF4222 domain-containing protein, partial [Salmonella enterica]|nr:DUF4222 domain-containing protein [Salmonella enterica]